VAAVPGIERVRFTSPHPIFFTDDLLRCYGEVPELCPHVHLPVQSGSTPILRAMRRRYDRDGYLRIVEGLRAARPDLAITTDLIVGFPGETREDFEATLSLVREVEFVDSFSFKYSSRPGIPAVRRGLEPIAPAEAQSRLEELQSLQRGLTLRAHHRRVGTSATVLVEGPSRQGGTQVTGRCPQNRVVNISGSEPIPAGRFVEAEVVGATPHSLLGQPVEASGSVELPLV
jgi:tRNA-2-methylthio-N6-dimethylallyladenosine synthase